MLSQIKTGIQLTAKFALETHKLFSVLADGRAYTLIELSNKTKIPRDSLQMRLNSLVEKDILKTRGNRKRPYYYLGENEFKNKFRKEKLIEDKEIPIGMKYCRHCYKHLAGYVGVLLEQALIKKEYLIPLELPSEKYGVYKITFKGKKWFNSLGIELHQLAQKSGRLTKQCLDFSERKNHLGGKLGDALLAQILEKRWAEQVPDSREIIITPAGKEALKAELGMNLNVHSSDRK